MSSRAVIAKWWRDHPDEWPELNDKVDWDEPSCWACGWLAAVDGEPNDTFAKAWQNSYLVRCHLADHWLGGPDSSENLVLLCRMCHNVMPSFDSRVEALRWVRETNTRRIYIDALRETYPDLYAQVAAAV